MLAFLCHVLSVHSVVYQEDLIVVHSEVVWFHIPMNVSSFMKFLQASYHSNAYLTKTHLIDLLNVFLNTVLQIVHDDEVVLFATLSLIT